MNFEIINTLDISKVFAIETIGHTLPLLAGNNAPIHASKVISISETTSQAVL
jgi:hypothetical protein